MLLTIDQVKKDIQLLPMNNFCCLCLIIVYWVLKCYIFTTDDQYKWLEKDLANVNREVTPWLVATWHPPWYTTYTAHYREAECMKVAMEDLLYQYRVDIVFNGHVSVFLLENLSNLVHS